MDAASYAYQLAEYQAALRYEDIPPQVVTKAQECVLDQLGVQIKGSTLEWGRLAAEFVHDYQGRPESTVVNYGYRVPTYDAAFANATFGHGCELDDYDDGGLGAHSGVATIPVAMALAELRPVDGRSFIVALVAGYDIISRLGRLMKAGIRHRGFHAQGVLGVFGAAATAAKMLELTPTQTMHALAIAGSHACCTQEYDRTGGEVKRIHAALAARGGIQSALLAQRGLTGPPTIFEGAKGILHAFGEYEGDASALVQGLGDEFAIMRTAFKFHPCLGRSQAALDAVARLMSENTIVIDRIKAIEIEVTETTLQHGGIIRRPTDMIGAQMSLAFSAALRLVKDSSDLSFYADPETWADPEILTVVNKIRLTAGVHRQGDQARSAGVTIQMSDGGRLHAEQHYPQGSLQNYPTWDELAEKFSQLAAGVLTAKQVNKTLSTVQHLSVVDDVSVLMATLTASRALD